MKRQRIPPLEAKGPRPASTPMAEIEELRKAIDQRNRDFAELGDELNQLQRLEHMGEGPGQKVHSVLFSTHAHETGDEDIDVKEAFFDAVHLSVKSTLGQLTEAETWRFAYRLAFLSAYNIDVAREALKFRQKEVQLWRKKGGQSTRKAHRPYKARALVAFRSQHLRRDGHPRKLEELTHRIHDQLAAIPAEALPAGASMPSFDTLKKWLHPHWRRCKRHHQKGG